MSNPVLSNSRAHSPLPPAPRRPFYGWRIVLGGTAILFVSSGIGFYGHGAILDPLRAHYGWSKGAISAAVTMYFAVAGLMGLVAGRLIDRYGPRPILILGSTTIGVGFFLLGRVTQLWQFFAVYLLMSIGWSGTSLIPVNTLIANWFIRRRGYALGITMTGLSLGGMILVPFSVYLSSNWGLETALPILGAVFWVVVIPIAVLVVKSRPSDVGQFPDGDRSILETRETREARVSYASQIRVWTRAEALRTTAFWAIVAAFLLALSGQIAFLVHQVSFLSQTLGASGAAAAVSLTTGASIIGRLFLGPLADRSDKRYLTMFCFLVQGVAVLLMGYYRQVTVLYLGTLAFGLTMGGIVMMQSLLIGECFGMVSFGTISGLSGMFSLTGAAFGPVIAGLIFDAAKDYRIAFTIFAGASLLAMVAVFFARPPEGKLPAKPPAATPAGAPPPNLPPGGAGLKKNG
ncbi:MAG: MFS transporter [Deltaproteobacteria bacterium]|nr:MFS transporter [Deltaproteobacteria bacterium]